MSDPAAPLASLRKNFWLFTLATIVFIMVMRKITEPLSGQAIVGFELAKTTDNAQRMLGDWVAGGLIQPFKTSVYLDFVFIILYSSLFFFGCRFLARLSGHYVLLKAGYGFSWLVLLAALCDVVENIGMLATVNNRPVDWIVHMSYDMATIKFSILIIAALFMMICLLFWGVGKISKFAN